MTVGATDKPNSGTGPAVWVWLALGALNIALDHWRPGTPVAQLTSYAFIGYATIWFGLKIRKGIVTRRPHWTRESWLRYARLAAMPVAAVVIVLFMSTDPMMSALGAPGSAARMASIAVLLVLLVFGGGGLAVAVDWLAQGEPSQQFTRTRWFQRSTAQSSPPGDGPPSTSTAFP